MADIFYNLKDATVKKVKDIIKWADKVGLSTNVTMLDCTRSVSRTKSDKDFNTVFNCIDKDAVEFFRIILRKQMNLYGLLTQDKVIKDILEVAIRSIDIGSKEYFIIIYLEREYLEELNERYDLSKVQ